MKRRLSVVMRRKVAIRKRLARVPRRCRAPIRGVRAPMSLHYAAWSFVSAVAGLLAIGEVTRLVGQPLLIGSFGASVVLLFGANESQLAQPRNLIGGHLLSALVAVGVVALFGTGPFAMTFAVATAIFLMNITHTTHPPGGATALIGVQGGAGLGFVLFPVLSGALILLAVACLTNNLVYHRSYPRHWL